MCYDMLDLTLRYRWPKNVTTFMLTKLNYFYNRSCFNWACSLYFWFPHVLLLFVLVLANLCVHALFVQLTECLASFLTYREVLDLSESTVIVLVMFLLFPQLQPALGSFAVGGLPSATKTQYCATYCFVWRDHTQLNLWFKFRRCCVL